MDYMKPPKPAMVSGVETFLDRSALGELGRATGGFEAVFLALSVKNPCIFNGYNPYFIF